jgi:hypothetical protein
LEEDEVQEQSPRIALNKQPTISSLSDSPVILIQCNETEKATGEGVSIIVPITYRWWIGVEVLIYAE